jgi:uncharacterized protein
MTGAGAVGWTDGEPRLVLVRCDRCSFRWYLPREHCPQCGSRNATRFPAAGGGMCVAVTRLHVTAAGPAGESPPLGLALVELDEGPVVMGRVHDAALAPGDRAWVAFIEAPRDTHPPAEHRTPAMFPSFAREGSR